MFITRRRYEADVGELKSRIATLETRIKNKLDTSESEIVVDPGVYVGALEWVGRKTVSIKEAVKLITGHLGLRYRVVSEQPQHAVIEKDEPFVDHVGLIRAALKGTLQKPKRHRKR